MNANTIILGLSPDNGLGTGIELATADAPDSIYEFIPASDEAVARLRREFGLNTEPSDI